MTTTTEADPAIVAAYREQAAAYHVAMTRVLAAGMHQAAALLAVQAVRSAALFLVATSTGEVSGEDDPIALLWNRVPPVRHAAALQQGANVFALYEDLTLYAYTVDADEACDVARDAAAFCTWALAPLPLAAARHAGIPR